MKIKPFILLITALCFFTFPSLFSQLPECEPGKQTMTVQLSVAGCLWNVKLCYECGLTYPGNVRIFGYDEVNPGCNTLDINIVYRSLINQVYDGQFLTTFLCPNTTLAPCPDGTNVLYQEYICWQKVNHQGKIYYFPCSWGDNFCSIMYLICRDPQTGQMNRIIVNKDKSSYYTCPSTDPNTIPDPPLGGKSDCFTLKTLCD